MRVLLINLGGIGDVILGLPFIRAMCAAHEHVDLWMVKRTLPLVEQLEGPRRVFAVDVPGGVTKTVRLVMFLLQRRLARYDMVVNMLPLAGSSGADAIRRVFSVIGGRVWVGRDTDGLGSFYHKSVKETGDYERYDLDVLEELLRCAGGGGMSRDIFLPVSQEDETAARELFANIRSPQVEKVVALCPGASWPSRQWPAERFAMAAERLHQRYGAGICFVILGGRESEVAAQRVRERVPCAVDLLGKTPLRVSAALLGQCSLVVTNDSGPMHLAIARKGKVVGLSGPGYYRRFFPPEHDGRFQLVRHDLPCSPCTNSECPRTDRPDECMLSITVDEVVERCVQLLEAGPRTSD